MGKERREHFTDDGGEYLIHGAELPDWDAAVKMRNLVESQCPDGWHLWQGFVQRSDRGRRCTYEVWFRKTEKGVGR